MPSIAKIAIWMLAGYLVGWLSTYSRAYWRGVWYGMNAAAATFLHTADPGKVRDIYWRLRRGQYTVRKPRRP